MVISVAAKLSLVVNNKPKDRANLSGVNADNSSEQTSQPSPSHPKVNKARILLSEAANLISGFGHGYKDVSSLIDECNYMLSCENCEPFSNLAEPSKY